MPIEVIRPADRDAWLEARSKDVTASVAAAVLKAHPYTTPYKLWADKTGRLEGGDADNDAMKRGRYLEPVGVAMLRDECPDWDITYTADNTYFRDPAERIGATPDAFALRPDRPDRGIVQIKSVAEGAFRDHWIDPDTHEIIPPDWIMVQAIVEAKLTGSSWACVAVVIVTWQGHLKLRVVDVPLHERLWQRLRQAVAEFWELVDSGEAPPPDWEKDGPAVIEVHRYSEPDKRDLTAEPELDALIRRYEKAREQEAAAAKLKETLRPQIIYALGNSEAGFTASFEIRAPTQYREAGVRKASTTRALKIKPREYSHAAF